LGLAAGCGASPTLPHFNDISTAPAAIQTAARAVVRVHTANAYGTGSFISPNGLLLTNNHVLGVPVCPLEGCSIELTFEHQRGSPSQSPVKVFAVPISVDEGLDMAVMQVYTASGTSGPTFATPDYLTWSDRSAASLVGSHVTVVGHPEASLKKWTDGQVIDAVGTWVDTTAYILPGDSGSPVLDDKGRLVGLMHHSDSSQDLIASGSVLVDSEGTASAPLHAAVNLPVLPSLMISVEAATTAAAVVANDLVYLNGNATTALVGTAESDIVSLLGQACDTALATPTWTTIDAMSTALAPCYDSERWIDCRADDQPAAHATVCPPGAGALATWASRYNLVNQRAVAMSGAPDLDAVSFAIAALSSSAADGVTSGASSLEKALSAASVSLDFNVAAYLGAFNVTSYQGRNVPAFVTDFDQTPGFELNAADIAYAVAAFYSYGTIDQSDASAVLVSLAGNGDVDVGGELAVEEVQYDLGWVQ
jgi:hypothetical protein